MTTVCKNNFQELQWHKSADNKLSYWARIREYLTHSPQARLITLFFLTLAGLVICQQAIAFGTPAAGSFGYNVYDIAFNKIATGPVGFVGGGWLIATAATKMNEGWTRALPYAIGGSCLFKVEELTTSLGALLQ
ncbi:MULTISPECIES: conjugative transfer protein TraE [Citrobacter]|uniref:conjugative transfer protein TraE n=1 Tax=Citrobacter TaxID=544 RepID=UPI0009AD470E|nr:MULTISPECIES: conjugative transfer protein TraE [Citrobacter]EBS1368568.1 conjugative transfer protein TraE [Salmonella enterica subsp. enterica serovar Virchow]HBB6717178.1 conjugative transfer protein TraE [Serratia marcescens]MBM3011256.1 conjugative transfer protein TraE [Citrobacter freundii]MBY1059857.1 conjugative transfer protein TraE [Citrobacter europaeus]MDE9616113.1 conjugative transfer protein TraE [Citrobacter portucalensis]